MELNSGTSKIKTFKFSRLALKIRRILLDDVKKPTSRNSPFNGVKSGDVKCEVVTQVLNVGDNIPFTGKELVDLSERMKICTNLSNSTLLNELEVGGFNMN